MVGQAQGGVPVCDIKRRPVAGRHPSMQRAVHPTGSVEAGGWGPAAAPRGRRSRRAPAGAYESALDSGDAS